jgi:hypothetical protein
MKFHQHPLNKEISDFVAWLSKKVDEGMLTQKTENTIIRAGNDVFHDSGLPKGPEVSDVSLAVFRHKLHVMKMLTIELVPASADEVRNWSNGPSR